MMTHASHFDCEYWHCATLLSPNRIAPDVWTQTEICKGFKSCPSERILFELRGIGCFTKYVPNAHLRLARGRAQRIQLSSLLWSRWIINLRAKTTDTDLCPKISDRNNLAAISAALNCTGRLPTMCNVRCFLNHCLATWLALMLFSKKKHDGGIAQRL